MSGVDVLYDAQRYRADHGGRANSTWWSEVIEARTIFAELIAADEEYDAAWVALNSYCDVNDEDGDFIDHNVYLKLLDRLERATERRIEALARCKPDGVRS